MTDYAFHSVSEIITALHSGNLTSEGLFTQHKSKIEAENGTLNAIVAFDDKRAEQSAKDADACVGKRNMKPLNGVFYTAKLSVNVAGLINGDGSAGYKDFLAESDAGIIKQLQHLGAICIGKTNMAEYGKGFHTENPIYGKTSNPFNTKYSSGGSGGGDSAAVASGFASFAIGADAGGSLRVPANACGLFGLCPTQGVLNESGLTFPAAATTGMFRRIGPITRSIQDMRLLVDHLSELQSTQSHLSQFRLSRSTTKKFCVLTEMNAITVDSEVLSALKEVQSGFEKLELTSTNQKLDIFENVVEPYIKLAGQGGLLLEDTLAELEGPTRNPEDEGEIATTLRSRIATELDPLAANQVLLFWHYLDRQRELITPLFDEFDFILAPVTASRVADNDTLRYLSDGVERKTEENFQFSFATNALGLPALAFPTGFDTAGLPLGVQIIGPRFSEQFLIDMVEKAGFREALPLARQ